jgi:hypothetical protein
MDERLETMTRLSLEEGIRENQARWRTRDRLARVILAQFDAEDRGRGEQARRIIGKLRVKLARLEKARTRRLKFCALA